MKHEPSSRAKRSGVEGSRGSYLKGCATGSLDLARDDGCFGIASVIFLAQTTSQDIAPPMSYSLIPPWMIFAGSAVVLLLTGLLIWYGRKLWPKKQPVRTPRERTLGALDQMESELEQTPPYQFSIKVSDVLRRYVLEQYDLPMTRQTSIEFLNAIATTKNFTEADRSLLTDFLDRCDLIKFARYEATTADSRLLLDEARRFVKGETLVPA
jgi:Domain of unknown function (DUF4381)